MARINYVFDGIPLPEAYKRTTELAISAHADDIEFMAYSGITKCFHKPNEWFSAVVVTDGAGSARANEYADYTDEQMIATRIKEQQKASFVGEYGFCAMLGYTSSEVKNAENTQIIDEIADIIKASKPHTIYTHNPSDKHETHIATMLKVIYAIRKLPTEFRPKRLLGCEVWRNLDWVNDEDKIILDCSLHPNLETSLMAVFDSQIAGGKRYDEAIIGRRKANATFSESHSVDTYTKLNFAIDLTPLITDDSLDITEYITGYIDKFKQNVCDTLKKLQG